MQFLTSSFVSWFVSNMPSEYTKQNLVGGERERERQREGHNVVHFENFLSKTKAHLS
jgi:hypothetical protein